MMAIEPPRETPKDIFAELGTPPDEQAEMLLEALADHHDSALVEAEERAGMQDVVAPVLVAGAALLDADAIAMPLPPLEYLLVELGFVAGGGAPNLLAGYGFSGKTLAAQSLLLALAAGLKPWGGLRSGPPRRCLHVDLEQGERLSRRRYQRLARAMGLDLRTLVGRLRLLAMPRLSLRPEDAATWKALMTDQDIVLVDSLRAANAGVDENSSEVRAGLDMLGKISEETRCAVIVIHHARKPTETAGTDRYSIRGSGAIFDACDSIYVFSATQGEPVTVETVKARSHGELPESIALVIEDVEVDGETKGGVRVDVRGVELVAEVRDKQEQEKAAAVLTRDADAVRAALLARPGLGRRDVEAAAKLNGRRAAAALLALRDELDVREEKQGRTYIKRHYIRSVS